MFNKKYMGRRKAKRVARETKLMPHESVPYDRTPKPHPSGVIIVRRTLTAAMPGPHSSESGKPRERQLWTPEGTRAQ
jgi:hypothetical protein